MMQDLGALSSFSDEEMEVQVEWFALSQTSVEQELTLMLVLSDPAVSSLRI